ncbi:transcriptional repressor LexA [Halobacteriovorax sp. XZX-3]|uniref:transcriptional repressor LexA n=1 Tax=unclassified Halobacteriovorax TaxID=2639665 RepID=UPI000CD005DB|nr:transcriptional repressor LexA [Halobacteriovorax sp. DA5]POB14364.1 repressor LexA [Halobacteriovorax sp. DA5]
MALTKKQNQVYLYIKNYYLAEGYAPTQKEIKEHFGLKSFGSVNKYMHYLQEAGKIEVDWNARRGIKLLDVEQTTSNVDQQLASLTNMSPQFSEIPLLGDVAAGNPIEAIENPSEHTLVPSHMVSRPGRYFALNVQGDSMINDGIHEGDILVCRAQENANQGQTVIALVDNEATVKNFFKKKNSVELHPANDRLSPFVITAENDFRIAGVVVGLMRSYE